MDREAAARAIDAFLRALGRDPEREPDLVGTGERVADAYAGELLEGYRVDVDALLAGSVMAGHTELVVARDLPVTTTCPHHLMPATGFAVVAIAPREHLVGVGTLGAVVAAFTRRLTLQEHAGERVASALVKHLAPQWAGCRMVLAHTCMTARGERAHGARVETVALAGPDVDAEAAYDALGVGR